ncbi:MAG TPA: hypothetical protein VK821_04525 [Dehalococcoidia bacterium]|nr:hypothetical protein [Dehalococcoidia bacterium]
MGVSRYFLVGALILGVAFSFAGLHAGAKPAGADGIADLVCMDNGGGVSSCSVTLNTAVTPGGALIASLVDTNAGFLSCNSDQGYATCSVSGNTASYACPSGCPFESQFQETIQSVNGSPLAQQFTETGGTEAAMIPLTSLVQALYSNNCIGSIPSYFGCTSLAAYVPSYASAEVNWGSYLGYWGPDYTWFFSPNYGYYYPNFPSYGWVGNSSGEQGFVGDRPRDRQGENGGGAVIRNPGAGPAATVGGNRQSENGGAVIRNPGAGPVATAGGNRQGENGGGAVIRNPGADPVPTVIGARGGRERGPGASGAIAGATGSATQSSTAIPMNSGQSTGAFPVSASHLGGSVPASTGGASGGFAPAASVGNVGSPAPVSTGGASSGFAPAAGGGHLGSPAPVSTGGASGGFAPAAGGGQVGGPAPAPRGGGRAH